MATHRGLSRALGHSVPWRMAEIRDRGGPRKGEKEKAMAFLEWFARDGLGAEFKDINLSVGRTPSLFNRLASAIAVLSYSKDGVTIFGETWNIRTTQLPASD